MLTIQDQQMKDIYRKADHYMGAIEPDISELLEDPATATMMESDGIQLKNLLKVLSEAREKIKKN